MSRPKVSVIIPVYNVEKYLGECLDSVLRQTFGNLEIICVDDGSTDSSPRILADYAAKDSRIKVITQPNGGLSAARNAGMDAASGKYIYFLDSDDYITDDAMERCVEICERDGLDQLVFGCGFRQDGNSNRLQKDKAARERYLHVPPGLSGSVVSGADLLRRTAGRELDVRKVGKGNGFHVPVWLRFFRLSSLNDPELRFPAGLLHEDEFFTPIALILARRVEMIDDRLYAYRLREGSITTTQDAQKRLAHLMAIYVRMTEKLAAFDRSLSADQRLAGKVALKRLRVVCTKRVLRDRGVLGEAVAMAHGLLKGEHAHGLSALRRGIAFDTTVLRVRKRLYRIRKGLAECLNAFLRCRRRVPK
ncbi:MAG: glycosyltransferase [Kiritimatiellae bacterium]|nr:glycosyltransferase [Kiritimatiellia bacterium]